VALLLVLFSVTAFYLAVWRPEVDRERPEAEARERAERETRRTATKAGVFTFTGTPPGGSSFYTVSPCRLVDTRSPNGPAIAAGAVRTFTLAGACGLPSDAKSRSLNVAGQNRANFAIVGLATNGAGTVAVKNRAAAAVHVILDTGGYFQ
jgi:hypothetical protein